MLTQENIDKINSIIEMHQNGERSEDIADAVGFRRASYATNLVSLLRFLGVSFPKSGRAFNRFSDEAILNSHEAARIRRAEENTWSDTGIRFP